MNAVEDKLACSGSECFALRVIGDDMQPEFNDGDIVIVEPGGVPKDGCYVLAHTDGGWQLRQLKRDGALWRLAVLNPARTDQPDRTLTGLDAVRGVVIQKAVPGRRRLTRFYV